MAKRCPPGVICIENITIVIVLIILGCVVLFLNILNKRNLTSSPQVSEKLLLKRIVVLALALVQVFFRVRDTVFQIFPVMFF